MELHNGLRRNSASSSATTASPAPANPPPRLRSPIFQHQHRPPATPPSPSSRSSNNGNSPKSVPCKYYQTGFCKHGDGCPYLHILGPQLSEAEKATMDIAYVSKTLFPVHAQNYKAAGVLPYRVKETHIEVLLGYEKRHSKTKSFLGKFLNILGGMRDHTDKDFIMTAVREFWEESARVLPKESVDTMQQNLNTPAADVFWWPKGKYAVVMYHMTHDDQLAEMFAKTDRSRLRNAEMEELHWVPLELILFGCESQQPVYFATENGTRQLQIYGMVLQMTQEHSLRNFFYQLMSQHSQLTTSHSSVGIGDMEFQLMRSLSQISLSATNLSCTKCSTRISNSIVYKCADCPNHILCYSCFVKRKVEHFPEHLFVLIEDWDLHRGHSLLEDTTSIVHRGFACFYCKMDPIVGVRWECTQCGNDTHMCNACESTGKHNRTHILLKIRSVCGTEPDSSSSSIVSQSS